MKNVLVVVTLFITLVFAACAKKSSPGKTAAAEPAKPKASTYTADLMPMIQMKCAPCHLPSKGGNKANFEVYANVQKYGAEMVTRIERNPGERGFMPFKGTAKLSADEIAVFKKWVSDGMLEK